MEKSAFMRKVAVDSIPQEHWGLPDKKLFPLHTEEQVKTAQARFPDHTHDVALRVELASNIVRRAHELGFHANEKIARLATGALNSDFDAHIELRKAAHMHLQDPELEHLKQMAKINRDDPEALVKIASTIQSLDRALNIVDRVSDPAEVVFGAHAELFGRPAPKARFVIDSEKIASMKGKFSDNTIKHLESGRPVHELPVGTREAVASFVRGGQE